MSKANETANKAILKVLGIKILGTDDQGMINFLDHNGRWKKRDPSSIGKSFLLSLTPLFNLKAGFGDTKEKVDWDKASSEVIFLGSHDFDFRRTKGLGAWRAKTGEICFNNGNLDNIKGEYPKDWVFIRKPPREIGLDAAPIDLKTRKEILEAVLKLPFETWQEGVKLLCWATLAPFSGALPWRPAGLLTGGTGSGKSSIVDLVVKPITGDFRLYLSGGGTTEAGIRQRTAVDAIPVILEESESDTNEDNKNRDAIFKLMRQSTSDDTPEILKGGKDGESQSFSLRCMFLFIGISPVVNHRADENRLFFCNIKNPRKDGDTNWTSHKSNIKRLINDESTDGIRALTWSKLPNIIKNMDKLTDLVQSEAKISPRQASVDAPLLAAYMVIWLGLESPTLKEVREIVKDFYEGHKTESLDETEDILNQLLDYVVTMPETREKYSLRELLIMVDSGKRQQQDDKLEGDLILQPAEKLLYKRILGHYGLAVAPVGTHAVGIAKNNHEIMKILGVGKGYQKQFMRHDNCIHTCYNIGMGGSARSCVVIDNVLK